MSDNRSNAHDTDGYVGFMSRWFVLAMFGSRTGYRVRESESESTPIVKNSTEIKTP